MSKPIDYGKSGNVRVPIYRQNVYGREGYVVAHYVDGKRHRKGFASLPDAKAHANEVAAKIADGEQAALGFTSSDARCYSAALGNLRQCGVGLEAATAHYAQAVSILGADLVIEAAADYARRNLNRLERVTFADAVDEFLRVRETEGKSPEHMKDLTCRLGAAKAAMGSMMFTRLMAEDFQRYFDGLDLSPRTKENHRSALANLANFAKKRRWLPGDWIELDAVVLKRSEVGEIEILSPREMKALLKAARPDVRLCLAIAGFAGIRIDELMHLEWSDIHFRDAVITVRTGKGWSKTRKARRRRQAPMLLNLKAFLEQWPEKSGKLWPLSTQFFHDLRREANEAAGIKWSANLLRHSFISYRLAIVDSAEKVALEAGNSPKMVHEHYKQLVTKREAQRWFGIKPPKKMQEDEK